MSDDCYYTTVQVQQLYGLTSANICHIVRVHHISKVKVGVKNLLLKTDVERAMVERAAKGAHPTNPVEGCADANPKTMLPNDT